VIGKDGVQVLGEVRALRGSSSSSETPRGREQGAFYCQAKTCSTEHRILLENRTRVAKAATPDPQPHAEPGEDAGPGRAAAVLHLPRLHGTRRPELAAGDLVPLDPAFGRRLSGATGHGAGTHGSRSRPAAFSALNEFVCDRVRIYLRRKHRHRTGGYRAFPAALLYGRFGLYRLPLTAPWKAPASAVR